MKDTDQSKLNLKFAWKGFREPQPSVTLHCSEKTHSVKHLKNLPKDLRPLAELVANPETKESVWLNACVAAGDKSLVAKRSLLGQISNSVFTVIGAIFAFLVLLLNFIIATLFAADAAFLVNGIDPNIIMKGLIESHLTGSIVAIGAGFAFWYSLLIKNCYLRRILAGVSIFSAASLLLLTACQYLGFGAGLLVTSLAVLLTAFLSLIASYCREALPKSFTAANLAKAATGILLLPAALSGFMLFSVTSGNYHSSGGYSAPTMGTVIFTAGMLFFAVFGQSLALSIASRTSSRAACALLSTCVQLPLFLGLGFTVIASLLKSFLTIVNNFNGIDNFAVMTNSMDIWSKYGLDKAVFTFVAMVLTLAIALLGSWAGAAINARRLKN